MSIFITPTGDLRFIWDDALHGCLELGPHEIGRVSDVEFSSSEPPGWYADLGRVCGPRLGPFAMRGDAIRAEIAWLENNCAPKAMRDHE